MIRRSLAGLVLGIALLFASLGWSGFVALHTVLDPGRSQAIADDLYADEAVRAQIVANLVGAVKAILPEGIELPQDQLEVVAGQVLADPAVETLINDALVRTHAAFLGDGELPSQLDAGAIGTAARSALVGMDPALDASLPPAPTLVVELPTDKIPDAGPIRKALQLAVPVLVLMGAAGIVLALVTTTDRPSVLRRAGVWALSSSAFVLLVGLGLPWLIEKVAPDQAVILAALIGSLLRSVLGPAIALAVAGVAGLVVSMMWPSGGRPRPRREEPAPQPAPVASHRSNVRTGSGPAISSRRPAPPPTPPAQAPARPASPRPASPRPVADARTPPANPVFVAPTQAQPAAPARSPRPEALAPRWVEGVGWVQHPQDDRPPEAGRWVPGVGYVLDGDPPTGEPPR